MVVRTFQLEDGVFTYGYMIYERESEEEKERSMAGKGLASWIGDAERGRKELKQGWRDSVVRFDWLGAPRIWTSAGVVGTWKDACLLLAFGINGVW